MQAGTPSGTPVPRLAIEISAGEEASYIVISDGERTCAFASSQDHKRIFDHDEGPNTGGMGAYSPAPVVTPSVAAKVENDYPARDSWHESRGPEYKGFCTPDS